MWSKLPVNVSSCILWGSEADRFRWEPLVMRLPARYTEKNKKITKLEIPDCKRLKQMDLVADESVHLISVTLGHGISAD